MFLSSKSIFLTSKQQSGNAFYFFLFYVYNSAIKVLQTALNKDYGAGLDVDGIWGTSTSNALGKHYVKSGETQYMVTAAEILLLLRAYDPNGVEIPGTFGSGLLSAVKAFQKAQGLTVSGTCDRNTFLKLIN